MEESSRDCLHAILEGRVQGVGFRWYVQMAAARRGLTGTVRNLRDGGVEVWAEGEQADLVGFVGDLARGPTHGRVDRLRLSWGAAAGRWNDFGITL
jgi:acylphosphatase